MSASVHEGGPASWTVHTEVFEGPLDLLLHLVKRDGVDLRRFPVAQVCEAYLDTLDRMRALSLSVASEHLVMASTLIHLKSLELLPRLPTVVDEEEDPRITLVRRLEEYAALQRAAEDLDQRPMLGRDAFQRGIETPEVPGPAAGVDAFGLLEVYYDLITRAEADEPIYALEGGSGLSFESVCQRLLDLLAVHGGRGELSAILKGLTRKAERVLTFIGALEMARLGWLDVVQDGHLAPVALTLKVSGPADFGALSGWVEQAS